MSGIPGYVARVMAISGVVAMTTVYVWSKVEAGAVVRHVDASRQQLNLLEEKRSKLVAAVERGKLPGALRERAVRDLHMVIPKTPIQVVIE